MLCTVTGTVIDDAGKPVAGVKLRYDCPARIPELFDVATDAQGHFADRQGAGRAWDPSHMSDTPAWAMPESMPIDVPATTPIIFKMAKPSALYSITGTVTDADGKPMAGVNIDYNIQYLPNLNATSDAQGHFTFSGVPESKGDLGLSHEQPAYPDEQLTSDGCSIQVPSKAPIALSVTRNALVTVSGRVVDAGQHPLAGVTVTCYLSCRSAVEDAPPDGAHRCGWPLPDCEDFPTAADSSCSRWTKRAIASASPVY